MNFLAHLYLAGKDEGLILGNFIADMVKGKSYELFPQSIQNGILMHRQIDNFTDNHPVFLKTKHLINKDHGRYSGVVTDMFYDHFLAKEWASFSSEALDKFVCRNYRLLIRNYRILPQRARFLLPFMIRQNWLVNYASFPALALIFERMDRRTNYKSGMKTSVKTLQKYYPEIKNDFIQFMPEIKGFASKFTS